jgi:hypothetical protein
LFPGASNIASQPTQFTAQQTIIDDEEAASNALESLANSATDLSALENLADDAANLESLSSNINTLNDLIGDNSPLQALADDQAALSGIVAGTQDVTVPNLTVTNLLKGAHFANAASLPPAAGNQGAVAYFGNNRRPVYSDGFNWRKFRNDNVVI